MPDRITAADRSRIMGRVRGRNTAPERRVRSAAHALGFRFRLHRRDLPGTPDLVFPRLRTVVFVHGCFWHSHDACARATVPKTNTEFWAEKLERNRKRDRLAALELEESGWRVLTIWECETKDRQALEQKLRELLDSANRDQA